LCEEELEFVLTRMGTTQSICSRDNNTITRTSADTGVWTYGELIKMCLIHL